MKKFVHRAFSASIALCLLLSVAVFNVGAASDQPSSYSSDYNSGERDVVCTTLSGTTADEYYTGQYSFDNLADQNGDALLSALRTLMTSTHKKNSSYNDCKNMADETDCENENGKVVLIYTSYVTTVGQANSAWNREHVWPKSLGGFETSGPGADLHHIRPSDMKVNSTRANNKYGNVDNKKTVYGDNGKLGGYSGTCSGYSGTYFEPLDNVKGDVARICLYMYVRYGGESSYTCDKITNVFQSVDVLLEWCEEDPVDTWEMGRNEVVADYQGNRNVFIDYPELAWLLFNEDVPEDMVTPSGNADNIGGGNNNTTKTTTTTKKTTTTAPAGDEDCEHRNTELRNARKASCASDGYTGDTCCLDCDYTLYGEDIEALGHENLNGDKLCDICDMLLSSNAVITTKKPTATTRPATTTTAAEGANGTTDSSVTDVGGADPGKPSSPSDDITLWIIIGVVAAAVLIVVLIIVIRARKKEPKLDEIG